ncbi:hypothetical protein ZWY2020_042603 [Hordeum vulgare]|nr:hypothetical protein ZWY2020_042603 [Hordeum vulgare]
MSTTAGSTSSTVVTSTSTWSGNFARGSQNHAPGPEQGVNYRPEGILASPQLGHIARFEFRRRLDSAADARATFDLQVKEEQERCRKEREARVIPEPDIGLVEFFLDTDAREIEIEIGRLRPRLNKAFFEHIQREVAQIKFVVTRTTVCTNLSSLLPLLCVSKLLPTN